MSLKPKKVDFDLTWADLKKTVHGVITLDNILRATWSDRFSDVYAICVAYPEPLGDRLYEETKGFLDQHVKELFKKVSSHGEENLLTNYYTYWQQFSQGMNYLNMLYQYLNSQHIKKNKFKEAEINFGTEFDITVEQSLEIGDLGLFLWRQNMIEPLRDSLLSLLLKALENDRHGESPNQSVVKGVIQSFVDVEVYIKKPVVELYKGLFEEPFLKATGEYYRIEASDLLQKHDCSTYMEKVIQRIDEETMRSRKFLHPTSYGKVMHECEQRMVADHLTFLHSECKGMVHQERRKDLQNMYKLLKPVSGALPVLVQHIQEHIKQQGLAVISDQKAENPTTFVENILQVHKKYSELIHEVFSGDQQFTGALDKACSAIINHRQNPKQPCRSAELLAKYCDSLLKKSAKGMTESDIDDKLSQSITVFKYIDDKDVFQKFYSRMLAKRLIHGQSTSMDAEEGMINRLKQACGYEFTNKLHRMFTDMSVSNDLNNKFNAYLKTKKLDVGLNFGIYVLQAGAWPLGQTNVSQFAIPQQLVSSVQEFELFYNTHFSGRKLTWLHHLCTVEMKFGYLKKTYLVTVGTYQMAMLMLFESTNSLSYKDIQDVTQLSADQFQKHLASLVEAKILLSSTADNLTPESVLSLNMDYSNKRTKFKITTAIQKETSQEVEQTHNSVDDDRKLFIQATIVRIMKSRKVLRHNDLIQDVISQSRERFSPSIQVIKKCIESLIDKQYIERTTQCTDEYSYIA